MFLGIIISKDLYIGSYCDYLHDSILNPISQMSHVVSTTSCYIFNNPCSSGLRFLLTTLYYLSSQLRSAKCSHTSKPSFLKFWGVEHAPNPPRILHLHFPPPPPSYPPRKSCMATRLFTYAKVVSYNYVVYGTTFRRSDELKY